MSVSRDDGSPTRSSTSFATTDMAGRVVGIGTHHVLMETCETYQEIVYSQLSQEEVA